MTDTKEAKRLNELGIDEFRAGEYEEAIESFSKARDLFAEAGDRTGEAEALGSLGAVYVQLGDRDQAHEAFDQALEICIETGDRSNQAKVLGNLGMLYEAQGDIPKAAEAFGEAQAIFGELGERGNEKAVSRQLKKLKIEKGNVLGALGDYQDELAGEEDLSGPQKMAQRMFGFLGRLTGGGADVDYDEEDEEFDVIDVEPLPAGDEPQAAEEEEGE
jgi:tetratricopeptide (TPR) repeat protein